MTYCKLGDRATIVHSAAGNEGKIVRIVASCASQGREPLIYNGIRYYYAAAGPGARMWIIESEGSPFRGIRCGPVMTCPFPDSWLRPLPKLSAPEKRVPVRLAK